MRAVLFHNPTAGPKDLRKKDDILAALKLADFSVDYISTKSDDFPAGLKKKADFFIVAGGDGTVHNVLTHMPDRKIPVAILPFGTANNVARSLGIGGTAHELAESWHPENTRRFDIGLAKGLDDDLRFVEAFGVGLVPRLLNAAAKQKKLKGAENLRKGRAALRGALKRSKPFEVKLKIDHAQFACEVLGLEVLNIRYTGPGLPLAPAADPGDELLEVVCIEPGQRHDFLKWLEAPQKRPPPVTSRIGAKIEIKWSDALVRVDDTLLDKSNGKQSVKITTEKRSSRIIVPRSVKGAPPPAKL